MGTLRGDEDICLFRDIAEEVVELFGVSCDARLFKPLPELQIATRDPLWDEPAAGNKIQYKIFPIKLFYANWETNPEFTDLGLGIEYDVEFYVTINHLLAANVPTDDENQFMNEGDIFEVFRNKAEWFFEVVKATRAGYINNSSEFTGYNLFMKRRTRFIPQREIEGPN